MFSVSFIKVVAVDLSMRNSCYSLVSRLLFEIVQDSLKGVLFNYFVESWYERYGMIAVSGPFCVWDICWMP